MKAAQVQGWTPEGRERTPEDVLRLRSVLRLHMLESRLLNVQHKTGGPLAHEPSELDGWTFGRVARMGGDTFLVADSLTGTEVAIPYGDVMEVRQWR